MRPLWGTIQLRRRCPEPEGELNLFRCASIWIPKRAGSAAQTDLKLARCRRVPTKINGIIAADYYPIVIGSIQASSSRQQEFIARSDEQNQDLL